MPDAMGLLRCPWIVGHHNDGLMRFMVESVHQFKDFFSRNPVQVSGWFIGNQDRRVGDDGAGDRNPLLLSPGELTGIVIHSTREVDNLKC